MSTSNLLSNVHEGKCTEVGAKFFLVNGKYEYYHTLCDKFNDTGWGCGYRTLQTICSWMNHNGYNKKKVPVPSIPEIQQILVYLEDKPKSFLGSREWIGSFEVCLVIDHIYEIPCKIIHVENGNKLTTVIDTLKAHFETFGSPIMMGGDVDCSSKGIMGIKDNRTEASLLVVDPHYIGREESKEFLQNKGWVKWQPLKDFIDASFYNLCLPQASAKTNGL